MRTNNIAVKRNMRKGNVAWKMNGINNNNKNNDDMSFYLCIRSLIETFVTLSLDRSMHVVRALKLDATVATKSRQYCRNDDKEKTIRADNHKSGDRHIWCGSYIIAIILSIVIFFGIDAWPIFITWNYCVLIKYIFINKFEQLHRRKEREIKHKLSTENVLLPVIDILTKKMLLILLLSFCFYCCVSIVVSFGLSHLFTFDIVSMSRIVHGKYRHTRATNYYNNNEYR